MHKFYASQHYQLIIYFITLGNENNFDNKQATPPPPPRDSFVQGKMIFPPNCMANFNY